MSVAELSHTTRLSKTTVKKTLDLLASMKLVVSAGKGASTEEGGKRPELYRFNKAYGYVISVHVTPDAIVAVTTDLHGDITYYRKTASRRERDLPSILARIADDVRSFHALKAGSGEKLVAITVALAGLADSAKGISIYSPHYPAWGRNVPVAQLLREALGPGFEVPLFVDNVNRWQALAERDKGVAGGVTNFIVIDMLDEGLGAGIVTHGELMRGAQALSGEIGHMNLNPVDGARCICGSRGCFEAMVSMKRIRQLARQARERGVASPLFERGGADGFCLDDLCELASRGDAGLHRPARRRGHLVPGRAGQRHHGERPRADRHPGPGRQGRRAVPRPASARGSGASASRTWRSGSGWSTRGSGRSAGSWAALPSPWPSSSASGSGSERR